MITAREAVEAAKQGLLQFSAATNESFASGADPGAVLFVRRLDDPNRSYYLVPWAADRGGAVAVQIDAQRGDVLSLVSFRQSVAEFALSPERAMAAAKEVAGCARASEPELVWMPCRESASPFRPFYHVKTDKGDVFVDMEGKVFTELSPFEKGG